jgi:predicted CXXCH cytochrome family protein
MRTAHSKVGVGAFALAVFVLLLLALGLASPVEAQAPLDIADTRHNLSVSGPGQIRALTETRICIFCHTPHNATPLSPLWNKELEPQAYTVYESPTLRAGQLPQPSGPTKLCLSCHDGTIAMGAVLNPAGGITMAGGGTLPLGSLSNFGLDLSGHHPVSFPYHSALPNSELAPSPPPDLVYGGADEVHCITCHDPHKDLYGKFLVKDNRYSALCITCHQMIGWSGSAHATSTESVVGILPRPPKTWPTYTQLNEWGCETCHTPHFAPVAEQLLNFSPTASAPFSCTSAGCHGDEGSPHFGGAASASGVPVQAVPGAPARRVNIARQTRKFSAHHEPPGITPMALRMPGGAARSGIRSVACSDCHNPHLTGSRGSRAPFVSGTLRDVSGIDRNGMAVQAVTYEYEVCFKCHADNTPDFSYVPRVLTVTNTRLAFDPVNASYHPVLNMGKNLNIPSIPSPFEPNMSPSVVINCTTCHADDEGGSRGPHGSAFAPILRERYETADNTPESYDNYALCYRCHNRSSILSDASFRKTLSAVSFRRTTMRPTAVMALTSGGGHSGHLAAGAPCSACHDAHGVYESGAADPTRTGSHTHLINFDTRIVMPKAGDKYPVFRNTGMGTFSGSCTLVCHGVVHDNTSYP